MRDLHLHLHAAGPATVAAVVCPEAPVSLHSSIPASKVFPKAACQRCILPKLGEEQCGGGEGGRECVLELRSFWLLRLVTGHAASLAHRQLLMPEEECGLISSEFASGLTLGQLTGTINEHEDVSRRLSNL